MPRKKPEPLREVDLDVVDVRSVTVSTDPRSETVISLEMVGGQVMNLILAPPALAKLEAMLAKASQEQARVSPIQ